MFCYNMRPLNPKDSLFVYLCRVLVFAIVSASYNGLLLSHPGLSLVGISEVLLSLKGVLQILSTLGCFSL